MANLWTSAYRIMAACELLIALAFLLIPLQLHRLVILRRIGYTLGADLFEKLVVLLVASGVYWTIDAVSWVFPQLVPLQAFVGIVTSTIAVITGLQLWRRADYLIRHPEGLEPEFEQHIQEIHAIVEAAHGPRRVHGDSQRESSGDRSADRFDSESVG